MHRSIQDRLEALLANRGNAVRPEEANAHLSSCAECASELTTMQRQADMLASLRAPEEVEPTPGFYARVLQRIEERAKISIWATFAYSAFAKRLTYASLTLAVMLGTYVVTEEARDGHLLGRQTVIASTSHYDPPVTGSESEQRDAVLENFAAHEGLTR
jgi:predicted anti-sigma-YlaC factor YlaD